MLTVVEGRQRTHALYRIKDIVSSYTSKLGRELFNLVNIHRFISSLSDMIYYYLGPLGLLEEHVRISGSSFPVKLSTAEERSPDNDIHSTLKIPIFITHN